MLEVSVENAASCYILSYLELCKNIRAFSVFQSIKFDGQMNTMMAPHARGLPLSHRTCDPSLPLGKDPILNAISVTGLDIL
jgi:hypothetical protein